MRRALCCSPSLSGTVFPFLLEKLTSGVSRLSTIALGSIEPAVWYMIFLQRFDNYYPALIFNLLSKTRSRRLGLNNVLLIFLRLQELYGLKLCVEQVHTNAYIYIYIYIYV